MGEILRIREAQPALRTMSTQTRLVEDSHVVIPTQLNTWADILVAPGPVRWYSGESNVETASKFGRARTLRQALPLADASPVSPARSSADVG